MAPGGATPGRTGILRLLVAGAVLVLFVQGAAWRWLLSGGRDGAVWRHAVVFDAGSSGTRAYVYRYDACDDFEAQNAAAAARRKPTRHTTTSGPGPRTGDFGKVGGIGGGSGDRLGGRALCQVRSVEQVGKKRTNPGLSSLAGGGSEVLHEALAPLAEFVLGSIPGGQEALEAVPVVLYATAGLRLMAPGDASALLTKVHAILSRLLQPLYLPRENVALIWGKQEGVLGWLTANTLLDRLGGPAAGTEPPAIMLDLGGASTQVSFDIGDAPVAQQIRDESVTIRVDDHTFHVYAASRLRFGALEAFDDFVRWEAGRQHAITSPCLFSGQNYVLDKGGSITVAASGTPPSGDKFNACLEQVMAFVGEREVNPVVNGHLTGAAVLALGQTHTGTLALAADAYWKFAVRAAFLANGAEFSPVTVQASSKDLSTQGRVVCEMEFDDVVAKIVDGMMKINHRLCWGIAYDVALLRLYGISDEQNILFARDVPAEYMPHKSGDDEAELNWAIGAMLRAARIVETDDFTGGSEFAEEAATPATRQYDPSVRLSGQEL